MMSFGKLTAAALSGTIDNTLALASLNFDFSLVKLEAPSEYRMLGKSLSPQRSEEAENGTAHITARKLGALFADVTTPTPNLFRAYGLRASEIAKSPKFNPKGSKADSIFADYIGADGTTIWAAATSGDAAIAVHLLACMLARIWPAPEATSIWVEMVAERKRALATLDARDSMDTSSLAAAQITLTRDQLAKWDAGARAWLLTADQAKELSQKQLMLIINNIGTPVNGKATTYESVMHAWKTAMNTVDNLVAGRPQSVQTGAPLLGLSSWHLYPDILVLGNNTKEIKQNDVLIAPGGLITVGLQDTKSRLDGVYWSLPLAYLRFYGDPVSSTTSTGSKNSRLSIDQLLQVTLGSLVNTWIKSPVEFGLAAEVLVLMRDNLANARDGDQLASSWLFVLAEAARAFIGSTGLERAECLQLMRSGRRRYASFLAELEDCPAPILGFSNCGIFLDALRTDEDRIWMLREVARSFGTEADNMVIRYRHTNNAKSFGYATATPSTIQNNSNKTTSQGSEFVTGRHTRWVESEVVSNTFIQECEETVCSQPRSSTPWFRPGENFFWVDAPSGFSDRFASGHHGKSLHFHFLLGDPQLAVLYTIGDTSIKSTNSFTLQHVKQAFLRGFITPRRFRIHIDLSFRKKECATGPRKQKFRLGYVRLDAAILSLPDTRSLRSKTSPYTDTSDSNFMKSLRALSTVVEVYKFLPKASIALETASRPLHESIWVRAVYRSSTSSVFSYFLQPFSLSQAQTFACIAMLESGSSNAGRGHGNVGWKLVICRGHFTL